MVGPSRSVKEPIEDDFIAVACMVSAVLLALALRIPGLGAEPLAYREALGALAAREIAGEGVGPSLAGGLADSALLTTLQQLTFFVFGASSDLLARMVTALVGSGLVLVPWLLRSRIGTPTTVALSFLLATDPWLVYFSRRAEGSVLATAAAIVCFALGARWASGPLAAPDAPRSVVTGLAIGVLLVSGRSGWDFLPPVLAGFALLRPASASRAGGGLSWRRIGGAAAAMTLVAATSGLTQWRGPSQVSASLGDWLRQWSGGLESVPLGELGLLFGRYQLVVLGVGVLGILAMARAARGSSPSARVSAWSRDQLVIWVLWGTALLLRPGRSLAGLLALQIPLLILAAHGVGWLFEAHRRLPRGVGGLARVAPVLLVAVSLYGSLRLQRSVWSDPPTVLRGGRTLEDVRRMASDVSVLLGLPRESRPVFQAAAPLQADPVLAWYLRDLEEVQWVALPSLTPPTSAGLLVATIEASNLGAEPPGLGSEQYPLRYRQSELEVVRLRRVSVGYSDP